MYKVEPAAQLISEADVLGQVLSGNIALYEVIIRRYNPYLYKIGRSYGFNHQDTEDIMQDTFVAAYVHLHQFEQRASFKTWLIKIMISQCNRKTQKFSYHKEYSIENLSEKSTTMFSNGDQMRNENAVTNRELRQVIELCLQRLPPEYQKTFALRELAGLSVNETAEVLQITVPNVKVRLNRAKSMLRKEIEKFYSPEDIYEFNLVYCNRIVENVLARINELRS